MVLCRILLHDLAGLILRTGLTAKHLNGENTLHTGQIFRLLHRVAPDIRHHIGAVFTVAEIAENFKCRKNQNQERRKAANNTEQELLIHLIVFLQRFFICFARFAHGRCHLIGGNGLCRLHIVFLFEFSADIFHIGGGIFAEFFQILQHGLRRSVAPVRVGIHCLHANQFQRFWHIFVNIPG